LFYPFQPPPPLWSPITPESQPKYRYTSWCNLLHEDDKSVIFTFIIDAIDGEFEDDLSDDLVDDCIDVGDDEDPGSFGNAALITSAILLSPTDSAKSSGVAPSKFFKVKSVPESMSIDATEVLPERAAACRQDSPFWIAQNVY
jgi:hypothetical protein